MSSSDWLTIAALCVVALVFLAADFAIVPDREATWMPFWAGMVIFGLGVPIILKALLH